MTEQPIDIPEGFTPHTRKSPLTDPWEPLFARHTDEAVIIGTVIRTPHTNSRGMLHGGLISALADNAMGLSCGLRLRDGRRLVTVSLSVDFLGVAKLGQWLSAETEFVKAGGTLCFAQAFATADGETVARSDARFKVL